MSSSPNFSTALNPAEIADRAGSEFSDLIARFHRTDRPVDFDFRAACKSWTVRGDSYTHRVHRYPARLTPYIPLFFLSVPGIGKSRGRLLDPFAGCGTVLVEGPVHPIHPMHASGLEINPLARVIARVKTSDMGIDAIDDSWRRLKARFARDRSRTGLANFPNKDLWFSHLVENRLARAARSIEAVRNDDAYDFFLIALSSVVRRVALADPGVSVPVRLNPERYENARIRRDVKADIRYRETADVFALFESAVKDNLRRLRSWQGDRQKGCDADICGSDARTFEEIAVGRRGELVHPHGPLLTGFDLIMTSPPYANAQRYTRSLRLELFALGFTKSAEEEGDLDREQVGTERVSIATENSVRETVVSAVARRAIDRISKRDEYRGLIAANYVVNMEKVIENCRNALKPGGHAVFVIGNNRISGVLLNNAAILRDIGLTKGFREIVHIRNRIPSRGLITKRHETAGVITHEHIVVLQKPADRA